MNFKHSDSRIFMTDDSGKLLAEVTFIEENGVRNINHTFVDDSLRGQGVAGKLMEEAVNQIEKNGEKIVPTCSFAVKWFEKHPEFSYLLLK